VVCTVWVLGTRKAQMRDDDRGSKGTGCVTERAHGKKGDREEK